MRASDGGSPPRNATTRVSVTVIGIGAYSANWPELSADNNVYADVMESDPIGHAVAFISAYDPDGDMLWYQIEGSFLTSFRVSYYFLFIYLFLYRFFLFPFFILLHQTDHFGEIENNRNRLQ